MRLRKVKHSVVILVDGLGYENLTSASGYARFLNSQEINSIRCEFPSTTATSIGGFATGSRSNVHGLIGYAVFDSLKSWPQNILNGWASIDEAEQFKKTQTISEASQGVEVRVIGPEIYRNSGFTNLTMKEATYLGAEKIEERFERAFLRLPNSPSLTYVYIPELDQIAHKFGVTSTQWLSALEDLDSTARNYLSDEFDDVGVILTADHGVIDIAAENHMHLDEFEWYRASVKYTAGDPRCNFVYLVDRQETFDLAGKLLGAFGTTAYISTPKDLTESGWCDWSGKNLQHYVPDLVIIWSEDFVAYDRRFAKPTHLKMIGQHGGISDTETRIPLIKFGGY